VHAGWSLAALPLVMSMPARLRIKARWNCLQDTGCYRSRWTAPDHLFRLGTGFAAILAHSSESRMAAPGLNAWQRLAHTAYANPDLERPRQRESANESRKNAYSAPQDLAPIVSFYSS
jgi:hypothetical protein